MSSPQPVMTPVSVITPVEVGQILASLKQITETVLEIRNRFDAIERTVNDIDVIVRGQGTDPQSAGLLSRYAADEVRLTALERDMNTVRRETEALRSHRAHAQWVTWINLGLSTANFFGLVLLVVLSYLKVQ